GDWYIRRAVFLQGFYKRPNATVGADDQQAGNTISFSHQYALYPEHKEVEKDHQSTAKNEDIDQEQAGEKFLFRKIKNEPESSGASHAGNEDLQKVNQTVETDIRRVPPKNHQGYDPYRCCDQCRSEIRRKRKVTGKNKSHPYEIGQRKGCQKEKIIQEDRQIAEFEDHGKN